MRLTNSLGIEAQVIHSAPGSSFDCLILPGVGSFGWAMEHLKQSKLDKYIAESYTKGAKIFGICLGMQLLLDKSFEEGEHRGLGLIPGTVKRLDVQHAKLKIPVVGQRQVSELKGLKSNVFYFAHSYFVEPEDKSTVISQCQVGEFKYPSVIRSKGFLGVQFHPELSGEAGKEILQRFLDGIL
jgi:imidazole glycerol-phosphate synthase subunit HisH